jgi:hypothetical protein
MSGLVLQKLTGNIFSDYFLLTRLNAKHSYPTNKSQKITAQQMDSGQTAVQRKTFYR